MSDALAIAEAWDRRIDRLQRKLPSRLCRGVDWIREPRRLRLRLAAAAGLILGGIFSFLPVLGLWMLPLGIALLGQDVPQVKAPAERVARRLEAAWAWLRRRLAGGP